MNGIERRSRRRRDGSRYDVWRVRWVDDAGRKRSATFDRERDARDFKAKLRVLRRSGELAGLDAGKESLAEFAAQWWELEAIPNFERSTLKTYASHWNCHVLPRLGHLELRKLTPQAIVEFRAELEGDGVGREAIRRTLTMLQGMLSRAVEWQRIQMNPVKAVRKPPSGRERAVVPLPPAQIERLRRHLLGESRLRDATLVSLLAYAGLRPEEALALESLTNPDNSDSVSELEEGDGSSMDAGDAGEIVDFAFQEFDDLGLDAADYPLADPDLTDESEYVIDQLIEEDVLESIE